MQFLQKNLPSMDILDFEWTKQLDSVDTIRTGDKKLLLIFHMVTEIQPSFAVIAFTNSY